MKTVRKHSALNERTEAEKRAEREKDERKRKERIQKQKEAEEAERLLEEKSKLASKAVPSAVSVHQVLLPLPLCMVTSFWK